jgi:succinate dehydrogenase / fumarate reductase cytochrome b subunit
MNGDTRDFVLRRLHSLTGIFPIGLFLLEHFYTNAKAQYGADAFNRAVEDLWGIPYLWAAEIFLIALPILFHGIYGLFITYQGDPLHPAPGYRTRYRALAYLLQRLTGVGLLVFIGYHVWNTRIQWALGGPKPDFDYMKRYLAPGTVKLFYVAGVLCACYHLANGLFNFAYKWGLTVSARSQERMVAVSLLIFLAMSAVGIHIVYAFR